MSLVMGLRAYRFQSKLEFTCTWFLGDRLGNRVWGSAILFISELRATSLFEYLRSDKAALRGAER